MDPARLAGLGWIRRVEFVCFFPRGWGLSPSGGWEPSQGPTRRHLKKRVTHETCPSGQRAGCRPVYTVRWQLLVPKPQEQDLNHKPALHSGAPCSHWNALQRALLPCVQRRKGQEQPLSHTWQPGAITWRVEFLGVLVREGGSNAVRTGFGGFPGTGGDEDLW